MMSLTIKKYSLALCCMVLSVAVFALEKVPGQIVYPDRVVDVTLLLPKGFLYAQDPEVLQKRVRFLDQNGKKKWLKPDDALEFSFEMEGREFRMVSQPYGGGLLSASNRSFLLQIFDGPVKMFEHRQTVRMGGGPNMPASYSQNITWLLQRGNEQLLQPRMIGFKKQMAEYFADCPQLVAAIQDKEFKRKDLDEIVLFYNNRCGKGTN